MSPADEELPGGSSPRSAASLAWCVHVLFNNVVIFDCEIPKGAHFPTDPFGTIPPFHVEFFQHEKENN